MLSTKNTVQRIAADMICFNPFLVVNYQKAFLTTLKAGVFEDKCGHKTSLKTFLFFNCFALEHSVLKKIEMCFKTSLNTEFSSDTQSLKPIPNL